MLALLYELVALDCPEQMPSVGECVWAAETAGETAVDAVCASVDRAVRLRLDGDRDALARRVDALLTARDQASGEAGAVTAAALRSGGWLPRWPDWSPLPFTGVAQVLDAVLVVADDGHAPGTRVRMPKAAGGRTTGTILGAGWGPDGPPIRYRVHLDRAFGDLDCDPRDLVVLPASALPEAPPTGQ